MAANRKGIGPTTLKCACNSTTNTWTKYLCTKHCRVWLTFVRRENETVQNCPIVLKAATQTFRSMHLIEKAFCRCTNTTTWLIAQDRFPNHASEDLLQKFLQLDFSKSVPEAFMALCQSALINEVATTSSVDTFNFNGCKAYIVIDDICNATLRDAKIPLTL